MVRSLQGKNPTKISYAAVSKVFAISLSCAEKFCKSRTKNVDNKKKWLLQTPIKLTLSWLLLLIIYHHIIIYHYHYLPRSYSQTRLLSSHIILSDHLQKCLINLYWYLFMVMKSQRVGQNNKVGTQTQRNPQADCIQAADECRALQKCMTKCTYLELSHSHV